MIRKASHFFAVALLTFITGRAAAQVTRLDRQLARIDFGVTGVGEFNQTVSGTIIPTNASNCYIPTVPLTTTGPCNQVVSQNASNTLGALVTLRYIARPYVGLEGNYTYARYTENYTTAPLQIQTQANEFTFGYVVMPPHEFFGLKPFASLGAGSTEFKPTAHGGQGAPKQARATYYYSIGVQQEYFSSHFGLRATFRQALFLYPDFGQNYLTIKKRNLTSEPGLGFYFRF